MRRNTLAVALFFTLFAGLLIAGQRRAQADAPDARGWSEGQVAAGAAQILGPMPDDATIEGLPESFLKTLKKPTLVVYFSPTCPHCQAVAPELVRLQDSLGKDAEVVLVATGNSTQEQIDAFNDDYAVDMRVIIDTEREIGSAMGARSTPSALLLNYDKKAKVAHVDGVWYPYTRGMDVIVQMRVNKDQPFAAFRKDEYHGNQACASCHVQEMDAWMLSFHSFAWATLAKQEEHENPECTGCHVTGNEQPTGWDGDPHSHLVDVGCESCHGPAGPHDGNPTEPKNTCEGCHDDKHSIAFSYEKGLPHIDHFMANDLSQEEWMARRKAVFDGEAPRALLAFPEGKTLGPEACESCHASEVKWWRESDHGKAMGSLASWLPPEKRLVGPGDEAPVPEDHTSDAQCVRCHASPDSMGPMLPTELEAFRTADGGVGCESCHGSAEAHVAAGGGKDNIQGLGESCPVCVLEAVCTTCHTKQWDPDWELEQRLKGVVHE